MHNSTVRCGEVSLDHCQQQRVPMGLRSFRQFHTAGPRAISLSCLSDLCTFMLWGVLAQSPSWQLHPLSAVEE